MKHFKITYHIINHSFSCECSTVYEAAQILYEIGTHDPRAFDVSKIDEYIEILIRIKDGHTLSHISHHFRIELCEGEI